MGQPKQGEKKVHLSCIFLHFCAKFFGSKIQNTHRYRNPVNFLTSERLALNGPPKRPSGDMVKNPKYVK